MKLTPLMQQYMKIKSKHKDAILLFRLGDFYEAFFDDAKVVSEKLDIVLTQRQGAPMAGVPYHALNSYLKRLVQLGYKVAICDQVEDPATAKGLVRREVTRIVTPGTLVEEELLEGSLNNYLVAVCKQGDRYAVAGADVSTGETFWTSLNDLDELGDLLKSIGTSQILYEPSLKDQLEDRFTENIVLEPLQDWHLNRANIAQDIAQAFNVTIVDHLELSEGELAFAALVRYIRYTLMSEQIFLKPPRALRSNDYVFLDASTIEQLGLLPKNGQTSLFDVLNFTRTSMGARLLKQWLLQPLRGRNKIDWRLNKVEALVKDQLLLNELREYLTSVKDLQRILSRLEYNKATVKDLVHIRLTLSVCPAIKMAVQTNEVFDDMANIDCLEDLLDELNRALEEEPSMNVGEGSVIKPGYDAVLDELRSLVFNAESFLKQIEQRERMRTGISNLRIGYNEVFGYYIEITKSNLSRVPKEYIRKQTLVNSERFITEELKQLEEKIITAKEKLEKREKELFTDLCSKVRKNSARLAKLADMLSTLDVLCSLATAAVRHNYVRPTFSDGALVLKNSRHPIVETKIENFVPNDLTLDEKNSFIVLTGPNMSGKSTFVRQIGLIAVMAQMGSFVPAEQAILPIFDRIFAKMGVRDDVVAGRSTFLTEMNEVAKIIHHATKDSLVLLDEVGRGTSTFDGISIAWAVSEYIHNKIGCKCVFATHFTELTELANLYEGILNKTIQVAEEGSTIVFLHKVVDGVADKVYGIEVAQIAGLPREIVDRAREVLETISEKSELENKLRVVSTERLKKIKRRKVHPDQSTLW
ncbi:MAG TPA: DNA mismatch repair protein MutS [Pseudothermotoga sp.]|uniref:DNA mismatch repair protein MutS n=1 Tax=Pseudothermotoga sp. TaxID=2033661 RepID=UPI000ADBFD44|nr:DNA mismatch repair protein MutS [Pseudothermotoga sp.]HCO98286.1 DNA mismatch repair protein MutS [Pseudothermotoga sp.]